MIRSKTHWKSEKKTTYFKMVFYIYIDDVIWKTESISIISHRA